MVGNVIGEAPVAVLTGNGTVCSDGASSFRGRPNPYSFGADTCIFTDSIERFTRPDGAIFLLTAGRCFDRNEQAERRAAVVQQGLHGQ